jgi:hypothetical protein
LPAPCTPLASRRGSPRRRQGSRPELQHTRQKRQRMRESTGLEHAARPCIACSPFPWRPSKLGSLGLLLGCFTSLDALLTFSNVSRKCTVLSRKCTDSVYRHNRSATVLHKLLTFSNVSNVSRKCRMYREISGRTDQRVFSCMVIRDVTRITP